MAAKFPTSPTLPTTGMEISSSMNLAQTSSGESGQEQLSALGAVRPPTIAEQRVTLSTDSQHVLRELFGLFTRNETSLLYNLINELPLLSHRYLAFIIIFM